MKTFFHWMKSLLHANPKGKGPQCHFLGITICLIFIQKGWAPLGGKKSHHEIHTRDESCYSLIPIVRIHHWILPLASPGLCGTREWWLGVPGSSLAMQPYLSYQTLPLQVGSRWKQGPLQVWHVWAAFITCAWQCTVLKELTSSTQEDCNGKEQLSGL